MTRALFLDRDGTLMIDTGYVRDPNDVVLLPGVVDGLRAARELGFELVVVSNQSGVARGLISQAQLAAVQGRLEELLRIEGVSLDLVSFCQHGPDDACGCRKPRPGMLLEAADARGIDLTQSVMVGDSPRDVAAGHEAGCTTIFIGRGPVDPSPDHLVESFVAIPSILRTLAHG